MTERVFRLDTYGLKIVLMQLKNLKLCSVIKLQSDCVLPSF